MSYIQLDYKVNVDMGSVLHKSSNPD